jgi:RNA polymerase sigma factor (sigma-70 family)
MPPPADHAAWFAAEVQPHAPQLRAWLASRFPQLADLDDIVQAATARVLAARDRGGLRAPKAFFFATARNLALDLVRRRQLAPFSPLGDFDDLSVLDEGADVAETVARNQEIELMTQALQALPDRCRQVMTLRNVYGLAHRDIAAQLGISVRTVEAQIALGLKRCTAFVRGVVTR